MLKVFKATDTSFTTNGDIVIRPLKAKLHRSSEEYYVDIEVPIEYLDYIKQDAIVVVQTNYNEQAFRVGNVTVTGKRISARCNHVFYDSKNHYFLGHVGYRSGTLTNVMLYFNQQVAPQSPFMFVATGISGSYSSYAWYESLYDVIVRAASRFNVAFTVNNYSVIFRTALGSDNGVVIQYGKNLKDISCEEDWSEVCTRVYPFGADGITVIETSQGQQYPYIDATGVNYPVKYIKSVEFDQSNISRESYPSETAYREALVLDLISKGQAYVEEHKLPKVTYNVKGNVEQISDIGDTIVVIDERLGIELETHVTAYDYDCITARFTEVTFGNYTKTAKGMGLTVGNLANNQSNGILAEKRLLFNSDNSIKWENITPPLN